MVNDLRGSQVRKTIRALLAVVLLAAWAANALATPAAAPAAPAAPAPELTAAERQLCLESFDHVWTTIRDKHFDPTLGGLDWPAVRDSLRPKVERAKTAGAARAVLRRMISLLGQSHFQIIPSTVLEALGRKPGEGSPGGTTGMDVRVVDGRALVTEVEPGSPADSLGVRPGWEVRRAGGEDLTPLIAEVAREDSAVSWREMDLASVALGRLEGDIGDTVRVRLADGEGRDHDLAIRLVARAGELFSFGPVPNLRVRFESRRLPENIGYVRFSLFMHPGYVMPAFEAAMRAFSDADGIVVDVRGNQGGMIPMAMGMAGWLVPEKDVFLGTFFFRDTQLKAIVNPRVEIYRGPVAVLADGLSVSCAEAFAGGLQDIGRARIFGARTAGMVLASAVEKLPDGDGFQYVFASYRSAKGQVLEGRGVIPDVEAPPERGALLRGEDSALAAAVRWIAEQKTTRDAGSPAARPGSR
jgi:carboxyl-terminal processing protease